MKKQSHPRSSRQFRVSEDKMPSFHHRPEMLAGIPEEHTEFLKQYDDWFTIDTPELKRITDHFVKELNRGLSKEGGDIVSSGA